MSGWGNAGVVHDVVPRSGDLYLSHAGMFGMLAMRTPVSPYLSMRMPRRSRRSQAIRLV